MIRIWFTGALYILAGIGYVLYSLLWVIRFMQTRRKNALFIGIPLLIASATCVAAFILAIPPRPDGQDRRDLVVKSGQSLRSVAGVLERGGTIRSARALVLWMRLKGDDRRVQAGKYMFTGRESILSAAQRLERAMPVEFSVTVPEGLTVEQTAARIARVFPIDTMAFARLCADTAFLHTAGLDLPSAEGYLFPETYHFAPDVAAEAVIMAMIARFNGVFAGIRCSTETGVRLDRRQTVILASIVEKEATVPQERQHISGVFHNRLRLGIPLGADPTVRYIYRRFTGPLRVSELQNPSLYNTRRHAGLPPGPICSPGLASLQAAACPGETRDLYFVARWDGSGIHDFSATLQEHNRKKEEAWWRNEAAKTGR